MGYFNSARLSLGWTKHNVLSKLIKNSFWNIELELDETNSEKEQRLSRIKDSKEFLYDRHNNFLKRWNLRRKSGGTTKISKAIYYKRLGFEDYSEEYSRAKQIKAYEAIVDYRKFEIELYWKRATYFWAFIVSIFGILGLLLRASKPDDYHIFIVLCVGFLVSNAWYYTNKGSKFWQRHWEKQLDLIEDSFTGPLYKTVFGQKSYSVSKINLIVSNIFRFVFIALFFRFIFEQNDIGFAMDKSKFDLLYTLTILATLLFWSAMKFGMGRGRFGKRDIQIYRRET